MVFLCLLFQLKNTVSNSCVVAVITPPLPRDEGTAQTAIQVHAVNLIEIRLGERWQSISNQSRVTGRPTTNKVDYYWWVP